MRQARGASLIEAMVAMAVMAFGIAGFSTSLVAASGQDRRNSARAAAHILAVELAAAINRWEFSDPRLDYQNSYVAKDFSEPKVTDFKILPAAEPAAPTVDETLDYAPDYSDDKLWAYAGASIDDINAREPGRTYVFRRYWNVTPDPNNENIKIVAVHVTFSSRLGKREVVTAFTALYNNAALISQLGF